MEATNKSDERPDGQDGWVPFLEGTVDRPPLPFLQHAMEFVDGNEGRGRIAVDLEMRWGL